MISLSLELLTRGIRCRELSSSDGEEITFLIKDWFHSAKTERILSSGVTMRVDIEAFA